jgi:hypothetical protein
MAPARKSSRSNDSSRKTNKHEAFVLCVRNDGYAASLERRKVYATLPDAAAAKHDMVRIVDESGQDYLYPADYFLALRLPASVKLALSKAS